mmetsp:Transcript_1389/g.3162  ORF Transcript_1389/g.3162 Transcript_1389/m.3162 type:complete len:289 (+) Transcript_1389:69-935(+)
MPRIGIVFELRHCDTKPGEMVCVRGSLERLGSWELECSDYGLLHLQTDPARYPRWTSRTPIWIDTADCTPITGKASKDDLRLRKNTSISFQYKYLKDRRSFVKDPSEQDLAYDWEVAVPNRAVSVTVEDGAVFVVSDESWNRLGQTVITQIRRSKDQKKPSAPQPEPAKDWAKWSFILSPRGREDKAEVQFPIEQEFSALDSSKAKQQSKFVWMEKQSEALQRENALLRQRLHSLEAVVSESQYGHLLTSQITPESTDITDAVSPYDSESGAAQSGMTSNSSASLVAS